MNPVVTPTALVAFVTALEGMLAIYWEKAGNVGPAPKIETMAGPKYIRLVICYWGGDQRSAYGFIDASNGDLLKSDGWKKPAKGRRGNIFNPNPLDGCTPYGMAYFRN